MTIVEESGTNHRLITTAMNFEENQSYNKMTINTLNVDKRKKEYKMNARSVMAFEAENAQVINLEQNLTNSRMVSDH